MYWDTSIEITKDLPKSIQSELDQLQELYDYYEKHQDEEHLATDILYAFNDMAEMVFISVKNLIVSGRITEKEGIDIFHKIGYRLDLE